MVSLLSVFLLFCRCLG